MTTPRTAPNRAGALGAIACLALVAVGCGDDDEPAASSEAYCALAAELDQQDGPPTVEQVEALRAAGPDEISEELDVVVDAIVDADGDFGKAFADPAVGENLGAIEAYEADACGLGGDEAADGEDEPETEPLEGAQLISVTGNDFAFEGVPAEISAGPTSFEFTNGGEASHEIVLVKLGEGVDLDTLLAAEQEPSEDEAQTVGFTFAPPGQGGVYLNVDDLQPGTYAMLCFIPGPENKAHHELGMKTTFTVS